MSSHIEHDIADLCQVAGISTSNYVHFTRTRKVAEVRPTSADDLKIPSFQAEALPGTYSCNAAEVPELASAAAAAYNPSEDYGRERIATPNPILTVAEALNRPVEITARINRFTVRKPVNRGERWLGLQRALNEADIHANSASSHQATNVLLFPSSGGVGVTTIAATLSRILSVHQSTVGIIENSNQSLIPMHFGARAARTGCSTFFFSRGTQSAPVHLLTPKPDQEGIVPLLGRATNDNGSEEWVTDGMNLIGKECEYMMVDIWTNMSIDLLARLVQKSICIVPLLPDVRSTLRVRPILDTFQHLSMKTGTRIEPFFILSKFDHNFSLHTDLRKWLEDQLKSRLIPNVLRWSDEISEALAEGEPIIDYAPNSGITEDFYRLAEWVQSRAQSMESASYSRSAAAGD